jgi:hypothetical protein
MAPLVQGQLVPDPDPPGDLKNEVAFPDWKRPCPGASLARAGVGLSLRDHRAIGQDPCLLLSNHHQLELVRLAIRPRPGVNRDTVLAEDLFEGMASEPKLRSERFEGFGGNEGGHKGQFYTRNALYASYASFRGSEAIGCIGSLSHFRSDFDCWNSL